MKNKRFVALIFIASIFAALSFYRQTFGGSVSSTQAGGKVGSSAQAGTQSSQIVRRAGAAHGSQSRGSEERKPFRGPKIIVVDDRQFSVSIQQTQQAAPSAPKATPKKKIYQSPRWVKTEHGVEVLEPGRWVEAEAEKEY